MIERERLERDITERELDFAALFVALNELVASIREAPHDVGRSTVRALESILTNPAHQGQKQSLFLYRGASEGMVALASLNGVPEGLALDSVRALKQVACSGKGSSQRAAAEALGSLPLKTSSPRLEAFAGDIPILTWEDVQTLANAQTSAPVHVYGRSIAMETGKERQLFVVKLLGKGDLPVQLHLEAVWMNHLGNRSWYPVRFRVPQPVSMGNGYLFRLHRMPAGLHGGLARPIRDDLYAIAYRTDSDYFVYVNGHKGETGLDVKTFSEVLGNCACLLGHLASQGIVHTAPIPLFHNRVQTQRRTDGGLYQWPRGGRLDRWLHSCRYPNLGLTGIRDFEHFTAFDGPTSTLYQYMGTHLLSLVLVAGSYFRNQDPGRVGRNPDGTAVDARHLFPRDSVRSLMKLIFQRYYEGFVGQPCDEDIIGFLHLEELSCRLVDEMGVDRHMEETFRVVDQKAMSEDEFRAFLMGRGVSHETCMVMEPGREDITLLTGPHLGRFNDRISVPELIQCVATVSALCVADRFLRERFSKSRNEAICFTPKAQRTQSNP